MKLLTSLRSVAAGLIASTVLAGAAQADPAMWRLSDDDSEIYIFGTVHILPPDLEWRSETIDAAFAGSDVVYFETPTDPQAQAEMQPLVFQLGLNQDGRTLSSMLDADTLERLNRIAPSLGLPPAQLDAFRPWLAGLTVAVTHLVSQGHDPNSGVEQVLTRDANAAGKTLAFFETPEEQLRFFADMPEGLQVEFLSQNLVDIESGDAAAMLDQLDDMWVSGDVDGLGGLINGALSEQAPELYERIIVNRNHAWIGQIEDILDGSGQVFIAVGAGHLAGDDSVIELLRARGHDVVGP